MRLSFEYLSAQPVERPGAACVGECIPLTAVAGGDEENCHVSSGFSGGFRSGIGIDSDSDSERATPLSPVRLFCAGIARSTTRQLVWRFLPDICCIVFTFIILNTGR